MRKTFAAVLIIAGCAAVATAFCAVMVLIGAQPRFTIGGSLVAAAHMAVPLLCVHFNL
jgi:ABC-type uncharacterized transport system permease subunit